MIRDLLIWGGVAVGAWYLYPVLADSASEIRDKWERRRKEAAYYRNTPDHIINRDQTVRVMQSLSDQRFGGGIPILNQNTKPHTRFEMRNRDDVRLTDQVTVHTGFVGDPLYRQEFRGREGMS